MNTQRSIVLGMILVSSIYTQSTSTPQDYGQDYSQDYKDDTIDDNSDDMYRVLSHDGYSDGYSQGYTQSKGDYAEDIFDDLFLPVDGYVYTQPDSVSPSRITVLFASIGVELLLAYCKVKSWLAHYCCDNISRDISTD